MVKILIGNIYSKIIGYLSDDVHEKLDKVLSYRLKDARYMKIVKERKWDGIYHLYKRNQGQAFYTGLLSLAAEVLKTSNVEFITEDGRTKPEQNLPNLKFTPLPNYEERPYQQFTIDRLLKATRGIAKIGTGGGKTLIASKLISELKVAPLMFYVLTKDLMDQAHEVLSSTLNEPIGIIGGGEFNPKKINVCTIQTAINALNMNNKKFNISDYKFDDDDYEWEESQILSIDKKQYLKEIIGATRGLFVDESHHAGAKTIRDVLSASSQAYYRYGLTATPWREDGAEIMLQAMFGKKIVDISSSYLIEKGYLIKPYVFFDPIKDNCKFHQYRTIYKDCVVTNNQFNTRIAKIAEYLRGKGLSVLILVQQIPQGEYIKSLLPNVSFVTSKMTRKNRQEALNEIRTGVRNTVIATSLFDEGIDCPCLDVVLMAGGGASSTRVYQRIGRSLRKHGENKDKALVDYFEHDAKHLKDHAKKAKRIIKAEPRFEVVNSAGGDFIYTEIDEIFGFNSNRNTILDI